MKKKLSLFMIATAAVVSLALQHQKTKLFQQMRQPFQQSVPMEMVVATVLSLDTVDLSAGYFTIQNIY